MSEEEGEVDYDIYNETLDEITVSIASRINSLEKGFAKLKNELSILTKKYEKKKQETIQTENDTDELEKDILRQVKDNLLNQRHTNQDYINNQLMNKFNSDDLKISTEEIIKHDELNVFQSNINDKIKETRQKILALNTSKDNILMKFSEEENAEFFNIINKLNKNKLSLRESNNDKAKAIQDLLSMLLNKFKEEKKEITDFEDDVIKLVNELCTQITKK